MKGKIYFHVAHEASGCVPVDSQLVPSSDKNLKVLKAITRCSGVFLVGKPAQNKNAAALKTVLNASSRSACGLQNAPSVL